MLDGRGLGGALLFFFAEGEEVGRVSFDVVDFLSDEGDEAAVVAGGDDGCGGGGQCLLFSSYFFLEGNF